MSPGLRLVLRSIRAMSLIAIFVGLSASQAHSEQSNGDRCSEGNNIFGQAEHAFGGGACYQGAPNGAHTNWQTGYCHTYHYDCP